MKAKKAKTVSSVIARKARVIATAVLISVVLFSIFAFIFYSGIRSGYLNDTVAPLHTVSGKCTDLDHKKVKRLRHGYNTYHVITINGKQYTNYCSFASKEDYAEFEEIVLRVDSVTVHYIVNLYGEAKVQGIEIPGGKRYISLEQVTESNRSNSNGLFIALLVIYLFLETMLFFCYVQVKLKQLPCVKTAMRKAKRKKERAERRENM